ncbi:MAG: hypothetical protein ACJ8R9_10900 [Steroidobacteraceae bacterium]
MSNPENNGGLDLNDTSVVDALMSNLGNEEIANLPLGSPEQKAALEKLSGKTERAPAGSDDEDEDEQEADDEESDDTSGDDESPESEDDDKSDEEIEQEEDKKPKKGIQKRFDEMTKKIGQLEKQLAEKTGETDAPEKEDPLPEFQTAKPKMATFENLEEYYEALAEWNHEKAEFKQTVRAEQKRIATDWDTKVSEYKKTTEDFDEVVNRDSVLGLKFMQPAYQYIVKQGDNPAVMYKLLSDEAKAEEFRKADAADQVAILTEIKLGLTSNKKNKTTVTAAPEPPPTKKKGATATVSAYRDDMSISEIERIIAKENKNKSRR